MAAFSHCSVSRHVCLPLVARSRLEDPLKRGGLASLAHSSTIVRKFISRLQKFPRWILRRVYFVFQRNRLSNPRNKLFDFEFFEVKFASKLRCHRRPLRNAETFASLEIFQPIANRSATTSGVSRLVAIAVV